EVSPWTLRSSTPPGARDQAFGVFGAPTSRTRTGSTWTSQRSSSRGRSADRGIDARIDVTQASPERNRSLGDDPRDRDNDRPRSLVAVVKSRRCAEKGPEK